jgi:hypothetical protein
MGNTELKTAFKASLKENQSKDKLGLTPEILMNENLITFVESFIREKMGIENIELDKIFPDSNI